MPPCVRCASSGDGRLLAGTKQRCRHSILLLLLLLAAPQLTAKRLACWGCHITVNLWTSNSTLERARTAEKRLSGTWMTGVNCRLLQRWHMLPPDAVVQWL